MRKQHHIRLSPEQRAEAQAVLARGTASALAHRHARILLEADERPGRRVRTDRVTALEIDGDGHAHRGDDPPGIGERLLQRNVLAIRSAIGTRNRCASRSDRLRAGALDRLGAPGIPDVEKDEGVTGHMKRGEGTGFVVLAHGAPLARGKRSHLPNLAFNTLAKPGRPHFRINEYSGAGTENDRKAYCSL